MVWILRAQLVSLWHGRPWSSLLAWSILGASITLSLAAQPAPSDNICDPVNDPRYTVATRIFPDFNPGMDESPHLRPQNPGATVNVIVLGDSVMWGDGLIDRDKFAFLVGQAVADRTRKTVHIESFAHSGARLSVCEKNNLVPLRSEDRRPPGDLDSERPSTSQQAQIASRAHKDDVDLVLMDGCINEVHATDIAFPYFFDRVTTDQIATRVHSYCAEHMADTLSSVASTFPHATILLMGYWRIVSDKSSPWKLSVAGTEGVPREITAATDQQESRRNEEMNRLFHTADSLEARYHLKPPELRASGAGAGDREAQFSLRWQRWAENSTMFLDRTRGCFDWAVAKANGQIVDDLSSKLDDPCPSVTSVPGDSARVYLVPGFDNPDYSYGASQKHIWSVPVKFLWWIVRSDEMYHDRVKLCNSHFTGADKGSQRFFCSVNPTAHPNIQGAETYRDSIIEVLERAWAMKGAPGK